MDNRILTGIIVVVLLVIGVWAIVALTSSDGSDTTPIPSVDFGPSGSPNEELGGSPAASSTAPTSTPRRTSPAATPRASATPRTSAGAGGAY